jgi:hypothetical protein
LQSPAKVGKGPNIRSLQDGPPPATVLEPNLISFIRSSIRSVWALELLLLLRRHAPRAMGVEEMARELRGTDTLVLKCLPQLETAGLIASDAAGYRFAPASPALQELSALLEKEYRERPVAVVDTIVSAPSDRIKDFADAFRFKEKDK